MMLLVGIFLALGGAVGASGFHASKLNPPKPISPNRWEAFIPQESQPVKRTWKERRADRAFAEGVRP